MDNWVPVEPNNVVVDIVGGTQVVVMRQNRRIERTTRKINGTWYDTTKFGAAIFAARSGQPTLNVPNGTVYIYSKVLPNNHVRRVGHVTFEFEGRDPLGLRFVGPKEITRVTFMPEEGNRQAPVYFDGHIQGFPFGTPIFEPSTPDNPPMHFIPPRVEIPAPVIELGRFIVHLMNGVRITLTPISKIERQAATEGEDVFEEADFRAYRGVRPPQPEGAIFDELSEYDEVDMRLTSKIMHGDLREIFEITFFGENDARVYIHANQIQSVEVYERYYAKHNSRKLGRPPYYFGAKPDGLERDELIWQMMP